MGIDIKNWISSFLLNKNKNLLSARVQYSYVKNNFLEFYKDIVLRTSFLKGVLLSERLYCIMNDIIEMPMCFCKNKVKFVKYSMGYKIYCSPECQKKDISSVNKKRATSFKKMCIEKYGVGNVFQLDKVKDKIKKTCLKKYGADNSFKSPEVRKKQRQVMIEKYGVDHNMKSEHLVNIIKDKYGGILPFHSRESKDKIQKTFERRYGGRFYSSPKIREKIKKTMIQRYGTVYPCGSEELMKKRKETWEKKYKFGHPSREHLSKEVYKKLCDKEWLVNQHHILEKPCMQISLELGLNPNSVNGYMKKHGIEVINYYSSFPEREILKFIDDKNCVCNSRKIISPCELDIYLPNIKLAIEYNGLFWHSHAKKETPKQKNYHLNKTEMCKKQGIQLFHIFENEWLDPIKHEIWKSIINSKLGKNDKIFARKCEVKEINDIKFVKQFINNNHLQGFVSSKIKLGLFHEGELVSLMAFSKARHSKRYQYEIVRACNKKCLSIVGGASKLFKYFIRNYDPKSIISYTDRRYSNGKLYEMLGFKHSHYSNPNYSYFKSSEDVLYPRIKFQKNKLEKQLKIFDASLSECQNMFNNNYRRIWDCGNIVFTWSKK